MKKLFILSLTLTLTACSLIKSDEDKAIETAVEWGEAFFNCDYHTAERLCTPDSRRWLQFAASNTTQQDIDLLCKQAAEVDGAELISEAGDTMRIVQLQVRNSISPVINGEQSLQIDKALYRIAVVKRNGLWQVRMEGLPRNEKRSHD